MIILDETEEDVDGDTQTKSSIFNRLGGKIGDVGKINGLSFRLEYSQYMYFEVIDLHLGLGCNISDEGLVT